MTIPPSGWFRAVGSHRVHYFKGTIALCRSIAANVGSRVTPAIPDERCATCEKLHRVVSEDCRPPDEIWAYMGPDYRFGRVWSPDKPPEIVFGSRLARQYVALDTEPVRHARAFRYLAERLGSLGSDASGFLAVSASGYVYPGVTALEAVEAMMETEP